MTFDVAGGGTLNVGGLLHNGAYFGIYMWAPRASVIKSGLGVMVLTGANTYTGTTISAGTLIYQNTYASMGETITKRAVSEINVASGSRNSAATSFNGTGTLRKTGAGELVWGSAAATFALGSGALIDVQSGTFVGGSNANEVWTNNKSDLNVAGGAYFNTVEAYVDVNKNHGNRTIGTGSSAERVTRTSPLAWTTAAAPSSGVIQNTYNNSSYVGNLVKAGIRRYHLDLREHLHRGLPRSTTAPSS